LVVFSLFLQDRLVAKSPSIGFQELIETLVARRDLGPEQISQVLREMMHGACDEVEAATVLIALRMKGESAAELAAAAGVLREHMVRFETGREGLLDTCGTGGDESATFNISTATALVAAGTGVPIVKHGNRAVSSRSGSADVLAALGVTVRPDLAWTRRCLDEAGLAFCFAPHFHPALRYVAAVRKRLGVRTIFNCLGPLANPAGAAYQLLGVGRPEMLDAMAGALAQLGIRHAFLVCGIDGLDEVSLSGPTLVREVRGQSVAGGEWRPQDFGLEPCSLADLTVADPEESATMIRAILEGRDIPATRVVIANAAAALLAAERVGTLPEGVALAAATVRDGRAKQILEKLIRCSQGS
jgi:anthranilate phosphoribosyltransferase